MLVRYSSSAGAGVLVTVALVYWMQLMIAGGEHELTPGRPLVLVPALRVVPPPAPPVRPTPPERPASRTRGPVTRAPVSDPTTDRTLPGGPATPPGPPDPPGRPDGRQGPWAIDTELALVARPRPIYPHAAIVRELEGYVIVEFTVTRRGTVEDIRIVESTHREFERAAAAAVERTRYRPRVVDGQTVEVPGQQARIEFWLED